jgi:hypothetical protein
VIDTELRATPVGPAVRLVDAAGPGDISEAIGGELDIDRKKSRG